MKYRCTVDIELDIDAVAKLWADERHFKEWQDGFQSIERLTGLPGAVGATSKILYQQGSQRMELTETILSNNLPKEKKALYEHVHMTNTQTTRFERITATKTRYISEVEYIKFNAFMPKLMAKLFPGMFRKQIQKWMNQFKAFAESNRHTSQ